MILREELQARKLISKTVALKESKAEAYNKGKVQQEELEKQQKLTPDPNRFQKKNS